MKGKTKNASYDMGCAQQPLAKNKGKAPASNNGPIKGCSVKGVNVR